MILRIGRKSFFCPKVCIFNSFRTFHLTYSAFDLKSLFPGLQLFPQLIQFVFLAQIVTLLNKKQYHHLMLRIDDKFINKKLTKNLDWFLTCSLIRLLVSSISRLSSLLCFLVCCRSCFNTSSSSNMSSSMSAIWTKHDQSLLIDFS